MKTFRLDRFLTINIFHPLAKKNGSSRRKVPIFMYHSISDELETAHPYFRLNTSPSIFESHMHYLHENNYSAIDLLSLGEYFKTKDQTKVVVITFDDGYKDYYSKAQPVLEKYGFKSTVFLSTGFIGGSFYNKKECLNWNEVKELWGRGVSFGAHTVTHPALFNMPEAEIEKEIRTSKEKIEQEIGEAVSAFSYPGKLPENGPFLASMRNILNRSNFKAGVSTRIGTSDEKDDKWFLKRIPVNSDDDIALLRAKMESGYDWLYTAQVIYKKMNSANGY